MILAGDIGATKTKIALFDGGPDKMIKREKYLSKNYENLSQIIQLFLQGSYSLQSVCFGIAGPVEEGRCRATNLPWVVDSQQLAEDLNLSKVWLINDLEANAYGLSSLSRSELYILNEGKKQVGHAALISAGTGLGEAGLFWDGKRHTPFASEGGHVDFAPRDEEEIQLWRYLRQIYGHVSYERILAGPGLYNLYRFLIESGKEREKEEVKSRIQKEDPPTVITESAVQKKCQACIRTVSWFSSLYGSCAGNLALKFLALGGVYLGGGIAPKIVEFLKKENFMHSFCAKGRFASLLEHIPVKVVLNEDTALLGAINYARMKTQTVC